MKVGQIYLENTSADGAKQFLAIIEGLDKLAIEQHVLVAELDMARSLEALPYVTVGPVVRTPVMAYCLMPGVDVVHIHDSKSGRAGLLLTLTRSVPFVMTLPKNAKTTRNPLERSILQRAQTTIEPQDLEPESLVQAYRRATDTWSKLPEDANCR